MDDEEEGVDPQVYLYHGGASGSYAGYPVPADDCVLAVPWDKVDGKVTKWATGGLVGALDEAGRDLHPETHKWLKQACGTTLIASEKDMELVPEHMWEAVLGSTLAASLNTYGVYELVQQSQIRNKAIKELLTKLPAGVARQKAQQQMIATRKLMASPEASDGAATGSSAGEDRSPEKQKRKRSLDAEGDLDESTMHHLTFGPKAELATIEAGRAVPEGMIVNRCRQETMTSPLSSPLPCNNM